MGYLLLLVGVLIILLAAVNVYFVFNGDRPFQFLNEDANFAEFAIDMPGNTEVPIGAIPVKIGNNSQIVKIANLIIHVVFAGFFVNVGSKIATVGTNLVRPIVVKANPEKHASAKNSPL